MEQPPIEELRSRELADVGAALQGSKPTIMARWRQAVRQILPQADDLTRRQLEDTIPQLLDRIASALASNSTAPIEQLIELSPAHGEVRYHQEFSLNQTLIEYHVLRRIVFQEVNDALSRPLRIDEVVAINQGLDIGMRQAAVAFAEHQKSSLKSETAAMTKFLSFLSHDLRGGLNGAVLMIEVLRRQLVGEAKFVTAIADLEMVRRSILDTVSTMERFLYAERLRLGRMPVKTASIDVRSLLEDLRRSVAYQLQDQETSLDIDEPPAGTTLYSDRQMLMLILQNLLTNAIKYGRRGGIRLSALCGEKAPKGMQCRFAVSDKGPGIAPEKLSELFGQFQQGDTYGQKGVGLGLFIARQASELLHAKLWAESNVGQGSTFFLDVRSQPEFPE